MSTRLLVSLLAIAIAWVSLFSLEPGQHGVTLGERDSAVAFHQAAPVPGSVLDHHLDDLPLQFADGALDLPDHQPIARNADAMVEWPSLAQGFRTPLRATVFLEGPLRPPIPHPSTA